MSTTSSEASGDFLFDMSRNGDGRRDHERRFLDSVQGLRAEDLAFDFFVHVKETVIPVHKLVLISFSDYFRAMLLNDNFKEANQGKVELKTVEVNAMKEAVEYMYTGDCSIDLENISAVLQCADMLQLEGVKDICFRYIKRHISDKNCVYLLQIITAYSNHSVLGTIEKYFRKHFFNVGTSDDFMQLEYVDASKHIHEYGLKDIEVWKVGLAWVKHEITTRAEHIFEIVKLLRLVDYPSPELLNCMWEEPIFKECPECVDVIHHRLFHDVTDLEQNLRTDNCIFLIQQAHHYKNGNASTCIMESIRDPIVKFMKKHLGELMALSDFSNLQKDDVEVLMFAEYTNYLSETTKWGAIQKWMEMNSSDPNIFTDWFQSIDFNHIPLGFINDNIIDNPVMKELSCYKDLLRRVCERHRPCADSIAVLLSTDIAEINLYVNDVMEKKWKMVAIPSVLNIGRRAVISVNGKLCMITARSMYFFTRDNSWMKLADIPDYNIRTPITAVVELNDCIYILNKDTTYVYTPISNEWSLKRGCGLHVFTATSSSNYLYVLSPEIGKVLRFNPASCEWSEFSDVANRNLSHILFVGGKLYVTNGIKWMQYRPTNYSNGWVEKLSYASVLSDYRNLITIGDKAIFFSSTNSVVSIHTFDLSCGRRSANNSVNIPNGEIIGACSFHTSESNLVYSKI